MELSLLRVLREEQKKNIALYGVPIRRAGVTREEVREFHIRELDLETGKGSLENVDAIILMKQMIAHRDIFAQLLDHCRMHHADIFDVHGNRLNAICVNAKERKMCKKEDLLEQIAAHDCISFDLFDTLLTRKVMLPEDVFELVDQRLRDEGIIINNFKKKRIKTQEEMGFSNPTIDDIYLRFCRKYRLPEEMGKHCIEIELAVESSVLVPRQEMMEIYRECLKKGKKVSLVTDMYIPERLLKPILEKNGIDNYSGLYISCERKQLKLQGLLEKYCEETEGTHYLHIGDHYIHDGICAALANMEYCLIASGYKLAKASAYSACMEQAQTLEEHVMLGMLIAKIFNSPFGTLARGGKIYARSDYDYGYAFCAPLISQFVIWLYTQIIEGQFDDILFAARDGYLIQRLYGILCEKVGNASAPKGIYFYTSRKAAVMTNINNEAYINMLIDISQQMSPQVMMREIFGLEKKDILAYDEEKYNDSIHKYVWDHIDAIFARADLAKRNYFKYIGCLPLNIGAKYAFMDFVSSGTSQKSLARIVPFELHGLYAGWNGMETKEKLGVSAFFEQDNSFFMGHYKIMETFLTSFEPSVSHFDSEGKPVFSRPDRSRKELVFVASMQKACEDFFCELLEIMTPTEQKIDKYFTDMLFAVSSQTIVTDAGSCLNHLSLMDNWRKQRNKLTRTHDETREENVLEISGLDKCTSLENECSEVGELLLSEGTHNLNTALKDADWDVFYQLSPMREGLFNWYSFQEGCHILELSCGYGGLTGVLCRNAGTVTVLEASQYRARCVAQRYAEMKNLIVRVGGLEVLPKNQQYDYIIVEKTVEKGEQLETLLDELLPFLMDSGRLLFVCSNRFGMKYWCGVPDELTHRPFGGFRLTGNDKGMSRRDLLDRLTQNTRLGGFQVYYPFPDERLPQAIYTDEYLPKASIRDRVIPYYTEQEQQSLVYLENNISDDLIANQVLPFFSNCFLIECAKEKFAKAAVFVALSTDRGVEHGFATMITQADTVKKKALFPEGIQSLERIFHNQQELEQRGIHCVEQRLIKDCIEMPFVKGPTLIEILKETFAKAPEEVEKIFDELYVAIQKSSNHISFEHCRLSAPELTESNAGVILERAYIDMIPYNCFLEKGEFLFYDQEFVKEGYPAKYILFRALRYTYIYITEAEQIIPLAFFKEKYMLTAVWAAFEREEARFVGGNRNCDLYTSFYRWAQAEVSTNMRINESGFQKKSYDIELYKKDYKLKAVRAVQLQMLKEFDRVCKENDLSYCAAYGTLLGVVRHKGYVPWDDDVDLMMPRSDFDKLVKIAPIVFNEPYFFQTAENDECFYGGYARLRNSWTTGLEERDQGQNCNRGIWIDILPLDGILEDKTERDIQQERIQYFQRLLLKKTYPQKRLIWNISAAEEEWYLKTSQIFTRAELCAALHETIVNYGSRLSDKVAVVTRHRIGVRAVEYHRVDFEYLIKGQFEDMEIPIPIGYENCLKEDYGDNYLLYPPVQERKSHHKVTFSTTKSYIDYLA